MQSEIAVLPPLRRPVLFVEGVGVGEEALILVRLRNELPILRQLGQVADDARRDRQPRPQINVVFLQEEQKCSFFFFDGGNMYARKRQDDKRSCSIVNLHSDWDATLAESRRGRWAAFWDSTPFEWSHFGPATGMCRAAVPAACRATRGTSV